MNRDQKKAVQIALKKGLHVSGVTVLSEDDWTLLLKAAGLAEKPAGGDFPWHTILLDAIAREGFFAE